MCKGNGLKQVGFGLMMTALISIISGVIVNSIRQDSLPIVPEYLRNKSIKHMMSLPPRAVISNVLLIDARPHYLFRKCHLPSAVNFPPDNFDFFYGLLLSEISKNRQLFILGRSYSRAYDKELAYRLFLLGHRDITVIAPDHFCLH